MKRKTWGQILAWTLSGLVVIGGIGYSLSRPDRRNQATESGEAGRSTQPSQLSATETRQVLPGLRQVPSEEEEEQSLENWPRPQSSPLVSVGIPTLGIKRSRIVAIPIRKGIWDVSGLGQEIGHLEGTAYPGESGNSVLAGHVTVAPEGLPGPFYHLGNLTVGGRISLMIDGQERDYRVAWVRLIRWWKPAKGGSAIGWRQQIVLSPQSE